MEMNMESPEKAKKGYKLWHVFVAFLIGALVASAVILVPSMGGAGFIGVKDLAVEEEEEPQFGLSFAKEYTFGSTDFDQAASDHYKTLGSLEVLFDSGNNTAFMFGPEGNAFAVKPVDLTKSVDLSALTAQNFYRSWPTTADFGERAEDEPDCRPPHGNCKLVDAKNLTIGSEAFDLAASGHYATLGNLEVLFDSLSNRAYMFGSGGQMFSVSRVVDASKLNLGSLDVSNFYDCWPKSL